MQKKGVLENYLYFRCEDPIYFTTLVILSIMYKLVLHAVGLVLAFLTRKIQVDVLNDYHYNSAIIISSSLLMLALCITTVLLSGYKIRTEIAWAILVFAIISVYLGLTFIPKVSSMYVEGSSIVVYYGSSFIDGDTRG